MRGERGHAITPSPLPMSAPQPLRFAQKQISQLLAGWAVCVWALQSPLPACVPLPPQLAPFCVLPSPPAASLPPSAPPCIVPHPTPGALVPVWALTQRREPGLGKPRRTGRRSSFYRPSNWGWSRRGNTKILCTQLLSVRAGFQENPGTHLRSV